MSKDCYFLASNHQNVTPIDELISFVVVAYSITIKNEIFVKSLNFLFHGTPQTAVRGAKHRSEVRVRQKLSDFFRDLALPQFWFKCQN